MTKINKKHNNKSLNNLNYKRPLYSLKTKTRQNKHIVLSKFEKSHLKKKRFFKLQVKKIIRNSIYKRQIFYTGDADKNGIKLKRRRPWKDRSRYLLMNKWRFWSYGDKFLWKQKRQDFQSKSHLNKKQYKKRYWINKFVENWGLNKGVTQVINNFNKTKNFSKKLQVLTKKIYYCLLAKKNFKMVAIKKSIKQKRFVAQFVPYKWQIIMWKLKQPRIIKKNFIGRLFYYETKTKLKRKRHKLRAKVQKRFRRYLLNYLLKHKQRKNYIKKSFLLLNKNFTTSIKISQRFIHFVPLFLKLKISARRCLKNNSYILSLRKTFKNNIKVNLAKWLKYRTRLQLYFPNLKNRQKLKKIGYINNKKQYSHKRWNKKTYVKRQLRNKFIKFTSKKFWKKNQHKPSYKGKYMWYNNLTKNHQKMANINKKNHIRLESPFFKKIKNYKKIEYAIAPKKYKGIFKNFYFKNIKWKKSFLLNKKLRKYEKIGIKKVLNEYNWKKIRKEPWFIKRADWLSWPLDTKNKTSPFLTGTLSWNNRWHFYYKQYILNNINKNKLFPVAGDPYTLRPFIRHLIIHQKHLPTSHIHKNEYLQYLFIQYGTKTHWTDFNFVSEEPSEAILGITNLTEKSINLFTANEDSVTFLDENYTFLNDLLHSIKTSSFISYKNWPRQIFQHTILLKNIHKRLKLINNIARKERLEYQNPQPRFENFHKLFSIDWRINKAAPWFEPLFFPRIIHPLQYFNFWYSKRSIYIRKRSKVYRQFSKEAFNLYEPLKYRPSRRGGHRNFNWNRILSKVLLPFFGKTFSQFQKSFNKLRAKKSKQIGRSYEFYKSLNSQLYRLIYNFNIAPSIFWARKILKAGWVYTFPLKSSSNTKIFFNSLSIDKLFPMTPINKKYSHINNKSNKFIQTPSRVEISKINTGTIVVINPLIKLLIKEFFSRRLNWDRRISPNYGNLNRRKNIVMISQYRYIDNFSEHTKDRSNTKRFSFIYN